MIAATLQLHEAARRVWDAVVVGAGPAGSLAARELARRGRSVLLVDRAAFPRRKVCGCCLNGSALTTLDRVGLGDLVTRCGAVSLRAMYLGAGRLSARLPLSGGVALSREAFDAALIAAAIVAGAAFLPETRANLEFLAPGTLRTLALCQGEDNIRVAARVVLAADGLGGAFLARAGESAARPASGARIGAGAVTAAAPAFYQAGTIYMACGPRGYLGLVRLEDGRLDLAAALDAAWLRDVGGPGAAAEQLLQQTGWPCPADLRHEGWRGTPPLTRRATHLAAKRVFALGDAAGYVEPFTGEGMAWALAAAEAVAPLAAVDWQPSLVGAWERVYRRVVRRRQLLCRAAAAVLRRPWLTRGVVALLAHLPRLAGPIVYHLNNHPARPTPSASYLPQREAL